MKIVILAIVLLLVGVIFVPTIPTANCTYCNRESCSNVTQFSSFTDVEFCLWAKYASNIGYWFEGACMYR